MRHMHTHAQTHTCTHTHTLTHTRYLSCFFRVIFSKVPGAIAAGVICESHGAPVVFFAELPIGEWGFLDRLCRAELCVVGM